jgi:hypothetical protein
VRGDHQGGDDEKSGRRLRLVQQRPPFGLQGGITPARRSLGAIGHELQHSIEALSDPHVTDSTKMLRPDRQSAI